MCRAAISVLLMLLLGGMTAFAASLAPLPAFALQMPCGGHPSCCVSPSPGNVPALPSTLDWHRSPVVHSHHALDAVPSGPTSRVAYAVDALDLPSCSCFSTVLRI
jgi:hypothetical protein